jgi:hypothetical protein
MAINVKRKGRGTSYIRQYLVLHVSVSCLADICVAIDRHESINASDWDLMLQHVASLVDYFDIETRGSRIGLVSFDAISTLDIQLDDHTTTVPLQDDILDEPHGGGGRDISLALFRIRAECFTPETGTL